MAWTSPCTKHRYKQKSAPVLEIVRRTQAVKAVAYDPNMDENQDRYRFTNCSSTSTTALVVFLQVLPKRINTRDIRVLVRIVQANFQILLIAGMSYDRYFRGYDSICIWKMRCYLQGRRDMTSGCCVVLYRFSKCAVLACCVRWLHSITTIG